MLPLFLQPPPDDVVSNGLPTVFACTQVRYNDQLTKAMEAVLLLGDVGFCSRTAFGKAVHDVTAYDYEDEDDSEETMRESTHRSHNGNNKSGLDRTFRPDVMAQLEEWDEEEDVQGYYGIVSLFLCTEVFIVTVTSLRLTVTFIYHCIE